MPLLIPVGGHLFTPDVLSKAVAEAEAAHPGKSNILKGAVDSNGLAVVLVLGADSDRVNWNVHTAFTKDVSGSYAFGAGGSIAW